MSTIGYVAIGVAISVAALVIAQMVTLRRSVEDLRQLVGEQAEELAALREQTVPLLADTRSALRKADRENRKADALLDAATALTGTADAASRLAYRAVTTPFVKVAAFASGTKRAAKEIVSPTPIVPTSTRRLKSGKNRKAADRKQIEVVSSERFKDADREAKNDRLR